MILVEKREPITKTKSGQKDGIKSWRLFWGSPKLNVIFHYLCVLGEKCFNVVLV